MSGKDLRPLLNSKRATASLFILLFSFWGGPGASGQADVQLKPDVPKLDTQVQPNPQPAPDAKAKRPLQGKIEKRDKYGNPLGGYASGGPGGGWGRGRAGVPRRVKGGATTDGLSAQVESGIGIIGVKFIMVVGRQPVINRVFPLTPAAEKGLHINDVIVAVDGVPTAGLNKEEVYDMIVGTPGSPVTLSINRDGDYMAVTMNRMDLNDISDPYVRRDYMMNM